MIKIEVKKENFIKQMLLTNLSAICLLIVGCLFFLLIQGSPRYYLNRLATDLFSDFTAVMKFALLDNPYAADTYSSYPPVAILILYLPALISKSILHLDNIEIIQHPLFWISFLLFYGVFFAASVPLVKRLTNQSGKNLALLCFMLFLSGGVIYTLERGNVIIAAFVFLLVYLAFYKSENKYARELALACLAIAGAIKIYPLLFGILLLRDKRWFCSVRVALYFAFFFLVPFLCFDGGLSNIKLFVSNLGGFLEVKRFLFLRNVSTAGLIHKLLYSVGRLFGMSLTTLAGVLSNLATAGIVILSIFAAFVSKDRFRVLVITSLAVILIPAVSYYYCTIFLLVPFFGYVKDFEILEKNRRSFYFLFFVISFCIGFRPAPIVVGIMLTAVLFYECICELRQFFAGLKAKPKQ